MDNIKEVYIYVFLYQNLNGRLAGSLADKAGIYVFLYQNLNINKDILEKFIKVFMYFYIRI